MERIGDYEVHDADSDSEQHHGVHVEGEIGQREEVDTKMADEWLNQKGQELDLESRARDKAKEYKQLLEQQEADAMFAQPEQLARGVASGADRIDLDKHFPLKDQGIDPEPVRHRSNENDSESK